MGRLNDRGMLVSKWDSYVVPPKTQGMFWKRGLKEYKGGKMCSKKPSSENDTTTVWCPPA